MTSSDRPVVVVGAGLAGLACATTLDAAGLPVLVLEADDGVGGRVRTDRVDGFLLDRGFQVLLTAYPEAHRQLDLDALDLRRFDPGAIVQLGARASVISDPFRDPRRALASLTSPAATLRDKARIALLRRRLRSVHPAQLLRNPDIATATMLRDQGFSDRTIERFFAPLFGGIQLDPALTTSRRMFDVIFRMLADGDSAVPAAGMQAIPDQLAARLPPDSVRLGVRATGVGAEAVRFADGSIDAAAVVVATEGPAAAELLGLSPVGSKGVAAVYFAADEPPTTEKLVVLDGRRGPVLNAAVMSNVAPTYAPPGRHLIVGAMPGLHPDEIAHRGLVATARQAMAEWWGPAVERWEHLATYRIAHGQPDQSPPFAPKQSVRVGEGVYVCGDHRDTGSIQGALYSGRRCAEAVITGLGTP